VDGAASREGLFRREDDGPHPLLAGPARAARARRARRIEVEDVLVAALEDPEGGASRTLVALGVDPAGLRAELSQLRADRPGPKAPA